MKRWWWLLVVALVLVLVVSLVSQLSQRERRLDLGFQGEAARNPLFLAERLLVQLGSQADSVAVVPEPEALAPADTLIMVTPAYTLTRQRLAGLLDWVEGGGFLIAQVRDQYDLSSVNESNLLLETLGVDVMPSVAPEDPSDRPSLDATGLSVFFEGFLRLQPTGVEPLFRIADEHGALLLQYGLGDGRVTVLTDLTIFSNERLVEADHADFLWELAVRHLGDGKVWLQYSHRVPSLLALLFHHGWMLVLGLSLALVAWLWQRGLRFGPMVVPFGTGRRSLLDHIQASGRFLWRHNLAPVLLAAVRRRSQRRLVRRISGWRSLGDEARAVQAARLAGLSPEAVGKALRADHTDDFLTTVKILKKLETL